MQECNFDHLDEEYTSPSSNSSSNSSHNSNLNAHSQGLFLPIIMTEPYQTTLKQQAVLYAGLDNNDANGGQIYHQNSIIANQNLIAQSHKK